MEDKTVVAWTKAKSFRPIDIDCATSLMLKILDGKCKMTSEEKRLMTIIYDLVKSNPGERLDSKLHSIIASARANPNEPIIEQIYEQRMYAEQMIGRPVMKAYKSMLRVEGILS